MTTSLGVSGLQRLPYELVAYVVQELDIEDVYHWSLCCKHFQYIIRDDHFCKPVVATKVPNTLEAREAMETGRYSRALRRIAKRREALSKASPYLVGIVACADSYAFFGGKLCYVIEARPQRWLRILDIHGSTDQELVVDIPKLIAEAIPQATTCRKYKFRVLYQAAGIVSCLFSFAQHETENWLLIIKPQSSQILEAFRLASTARIFVRNNDKFLYFGTHSEEGADGLRRWALKGYDLTTNSWLPHPRVYMASLAGYEIGSSVCFEIFGDYFYGVSNRTLNEIDDPNWRSYYYCFRFPLSDPSHSKLQVMGSEDSWRRSHQEGPIDDRWGFLSLEMDEASGDIVILECRKEWLNGESNSKRTYYTTEVIFRENTTQRVYQRLGADTTTRGVRDHAQSDSNIQWLPQYAHLDERPDASLWIRSKMHFCAYIRCCHTFIDLINDTDSDASGEPQLRLRTGYRRLKPGVRLPSRQSILETVRYVSEPTMQPHGVHNPYQPNKRYIWPPKQDSRELDISLDRVRQLLDIQGYQGRVAATGDERSVIYATSDGSKGSVQALVFITFDPAARFEGMTYGGNILGQQIPSDVYDSADLDADQRAKSSTMLQSGPNVSMGAAVRQSGADTAANQLSLDAALDSSAGPSLPPHHDASSVESWACYENAMHLAIQRKLYFSR
ncbi:hypothetical protein F5B22DRAFT_658181 [Xylaria bambusicola]|uniref:uncharacterized protein n=1 Tax=Xylaria bambusicola TaxID=326684 RepID=UPI00200871D8|nr:uncharacterized protein F5B22DRAFT_658181 [Xylaria bambusicola]KAI0509440.1 hypothetical protein F5B22DRAFT_658181 [Xylaria bambusicola]